VNHHLRYGWSSASSNMQYNTWLFGGKTSMFEIWTFPNTEFYLPYFSAKVQFLSISFVCEKFKFWSLDVPDLIIAFVRRKDGKSSIPEVWTWGQLHFFGGKFNFWSPDFPQLHFFGGKVKFLKYGRATIDNCMFFGGKVQFLSSGLGDNCIFWGEKVSSWSAKIEPK
jgi:hypothetical protein